MHLDGHPRYHHDGPVAPVAASARSTFGHRRPRVRRFAARPRDGFDPDLLAATPRFRALAFAGARLAGLAFAFDLAFARVFIFALAFAFPFARAFDAAGALAALLRAGRGAATGAVIW